MSRMHSFNFSLVFLPSSISLVDLPYSTFSLCWPAHRDVPFSCLLLEVYTLLPGSFFLKFANYTARDMKQPFVTWLVSPSFLSSQMICVPLVFSLLLCLCSTYQNRPKQCNGCYVSMIIKATVFKLLYEGLGFLSVLRCVWKQLGLFFGKRSFRVGTVFLSSH